MRIFAIKDDTLSQEIVLGYLIYYENAKAFYIELPEDADPWETPLLLSSFVKRGERSVSSYWSRLWVQQRIIPRDRQNIGQVLKENGLKEYETWLCASKDFKQRGESKIALDAYYQAESLPNESPMDFCIRNGWESTVYEMLVVDYLILNRDRHGANMEVLRNQRKKTIRLAPLFDHGLSLLSRCESTEAMLREDVMADKPVQCFVGSRSSWENLQLIPRDRRPPLHPLAENDRAILLEGLSEALDQQWLDRIWEMIWKRWQAYEDLCNQG